MQQVPAVSPQVGERVMYRLGSVAPGPAVLITGETVHVPFGIVANGMSHIKRVIGFNSACKGWVVKADLFIGGRDLPDSQLIVSPEPDSDGDWREVAPQACAIPNCTGKAINTGKCLVHSV